jgi:hypothetical protein
MNEFITVSLITNLRMFSLWLYGYIEFLTIFLTITSLWLVTKVTFYAVTDKEREFFIFCQCYEGKRR